MCCRWRTGFRHVSVDSIIGTFSMAFRYLLFGNSFTKRVWLTVCACVWVCECSNIKLYKCIDSTFGYCSFVCRFYYFNNIIKLPPSSPQWGHPFTFVRNPFGLCLHEKWVAILFHFISLPLVLRSAHTGCWTY